MNVIINEHLAKTNILETEDWMTILVVLGYWENMEIPFPT